MLFICHLTNVVSTYLLTEETFCPRPASNRKYVPSRQRLPLVKRAYTCLTGCQTEKGSRLPDRHACLSVCYGGRVLLLDLRYTCLTVNDTICVAYNNRKYYIDVVEAKPADAICTVDTDCEVTLVPTYYDPLLTPHMTR